MKEALKVLSSQLWSASGALKNRHKDNSHDTIKETWHISSHEFEGTNGALFHGWFQQVPPILWLSTLLMTEYVQKCEQHRYIQRCFHVEHCVSESSTGVLSKMWDRKNM